jgi:hypothetical protein
MSDEQSVADDPQPAAPRLSWVSMVRTARAPAGIVAIVLFALVFLPQMDDMLARIREDWGQDVAYHLSLFFFAFSAWYWSRTLLAARFRVRNRRLINGPEEVRRSVKGMDVNPTAFRLVPRVLFVAIAFCGVVAALKSSDWPDALITVVWAAAGYILLEYRRALTGWLRDRFSGPRMAAPQ